MGVKIRETTREDISFIAANLRDEDVAELRAARGDDVPLDTLLYYSFESSTRTGTFTDGQGRPFALFGVAANSERPYVGVPWLLGTEAVKDNAKGFIVLAKKELAQWSEFEYLHNFVHNENLTSKRFLEHIGFTIHNPEPRGPKGELFYSFSKGDPSVCIRPYAQATLLGGIREDTNHV